MRVEGEIRGDTKGSDTLVEAPSLDSGRSALASAERLVAMLAQKRDCCRALLELSSRQEPTLARGDIGELLRLLGAKQRILGQMDQIQRECGESLRDWPARRRELAEPARGRCDALLAETERLLAETVAQERRSEADLQRQRDAALERLRQNAEGRRARDVYAAGVLPGAVAIDLQS